MSEKIYTVQIRISLLLNIELNFRIYFYAKCHKELSWRIRNLNTNMKCV